MQKQKDKTILFISQSFYPQIGGVSSLLLNLSKYFSTKNISVKVLHFGIEGDESATNILGFGIEQHRVEKEKLDPTILSGYAHFKEILYKHLHGVGQFNYTEIEKVPGYFEYMQVIEKFKEQLLLVISQNEIDHIYLHDYQVLPCISIVNSNIRVTVGLHVPLLNNLNEVVLKWFIDNLTHASNTVLSIPSYATPLIQAGLIKNSIRIIPPIIDERLMEKNTINPEFVNKIEKKDVIVTCVQRFDSKSGQLNLIKAFYLANKRVPNTKLVLVGEGSFTDTISNIRKNYYQEAVSLVHHLGLEDSIIFTGNIPYEQLSVVYEKSDIIVSLSIMECYGLTITEATNYGKPVIVSDVGGLKYQVNKYKNGYVVDHNKINELAEKLIKLIKSRKKRFYYGKLGKFLYNNVYTKEKTMKNYLKLFN